MIFIYTPTERGLGIGSFLIQIFIRACQQQNVKLITAVVNTWGELPANDVVNFYQRNGFNIDRGSAYREI